MAADPFALGKLGGSVLWADESDDEEEQIEQQRKISQKYAAKSDSVDEFDAIKQSKQQKGAGKAGKKKKQVMDMRDFLKPTEEEQLPPPPPTEQKQRQAREPREPSKADVESNWRRATPLEVQQQENKTNAGYQRKVSVQSAADIADTWGRKPSTEENWKRNGPRDDNNSPQFKQKPRMEQQPSRADMDDNWNTKKPTPVSTPQSADARKPSQFAPNRFADDGQSWTRGGKFEPTSSPSPTKGRKSPLKSQADQVQNWSANKRAQPPTPPPEQNRTPASPEGASRWDIGSRFQPTQAELEQQQGPPPPRQAQPKDNWRQRPQEDDWKATKQASMIQSGNQQPAQPPPPRRRQPPSKAEGNWRRDDTAKGEAEIDPAASVPADEAGSPEAADTPVPSDTQAEQDRLAPVKVPGKPEQGVADAPTQSVAPPTPPKPAPEAPAIVAQSGSLPVEVAQPETECAAETAVEEPVTPAEQPDVAPAPEPAPTPAEGVDASTDDAPAPAEVAVQKLEEVAAAEEGVGEGDAEVDAEEEAVAKDDSAKDDADAGVSAHANGDVSMPEEDAKKTPFNQAPVSTPPPKVNPWQQPAKSQANGTPTPPAPQSHASTPNSQGASRTQAPARSSDFFSRNKSMADQEERWGHRAFERSHTGGERGRGRGAKRGGGAPRGRGEGGRGSYRGGPPREGGRGGAPRGSGRGGRGGERAERPSTKAKAQPEETDDGWTVVRHK